MYEVELVNQANTLLDLYQQLYEERYRTKPITSINGNDRTFCKDLIRQLGYGKARSLIEGFLRSQHPWFKQKSHSLVSLKGNLDVVNTEVARGQQAPETNNSLVIMDALDVGVWYFKNSKLVRDSYKIHNEDEIEAHVRKRIFG